MKGDLYSVRILRRGDAPEAAKDKLGRTPSDLRPEGFGIGFDTDVEMHPPGNVIDEQVALGFSALALDGVDTSEHGQSESEDSVPDAKEPDSIAVESFADGDKGGGGSVGYQFAPGLKEPVTELVPQILPSPSSDISSNVSRILREAALKRTHISTRPITPGCDSDGGSRTNTMTIKWVRRSLYELFLIVWASNVGSLNQGMFENDVREPYTSLHVNSKLRVFPGYSRSDP